jgi:uncharacterized protein YkwD
MAVRLVSPDPPTWSPPPAHRGPALAPIGLAPAAPAPAYTWADDFVCWQLWAYHTAERRAVGLPDLANGGPLFKVPYRFARELATTGVLTHTRQSGVPFYQEIAAALGGYSACSENAAMGQRSAAEVMAAWMASPGHRANVLGPWRRFAGSRAYTPDGVASWVCDFAA